MAELRDRLQAALAGAYRLEQELGGGGMSRVFVALETDLGRKVVVKVLPPEMAAGVNADRFRREIQLAASLQHPHIVPLLHAGRSDDLVWYTMPLIEGESLRTKLAKGGELPIGEAVRLLRDVADALAYAHAHGVVHRDIKPDNVLISGRHALVTDFGVAKAISESTGEVSLTSIGVALGTPAYMAPEQAAAENVDHRADIYALGALAYEVLAGRPPFTGGNAQQVLAAHVTQPADPITKHRASVPPALAALVMRCLEKKPADRWQSATEVHTQLEGMATPTGGTVPTTAVPAAAPGLRAALARRSLPRRVAAGAIIVAAVALALWRLTRGGATPLDANVVAVLPFRVAGADAALHYLREGMIDLLAAKLTGEGGPRAADPRTVTSAYRRAAGDEAKDLSQDEALDVARGIGAGQALLGGVVGSPAHVTVSATLVGVPGGGTRAQASVAGPADSLPALVDQLTAQLLVRGAGIGTQGEASLTTRSLPALQAYLSGQRAYRRGAYDSAVAHLTRALQADSTFALAAFALVLTNGWGAAVPDIGRVRRLAWAGRERLSNRDRLMLEAYLGTSYPEPPTEAELLAARERAVSVAPDRADAWYFLGDKYFHEGEYLGYEDWQARARAGFERAVALDSTFAGPLSHLVNLANMTHDTAAARRYGNLYLANEEAHGGRFDLLVRWELARTLQDRDMLRRFWIEFDTTASRPSYAAGTALIEYQDQAAVDSLLAILARRASSQDERFGLLQSRWFVELNRGHPSVKIAVGDSLERLMGTVGTPAAAITRILGALYADGDTARAAVAAQQLAPLVDGATAESGDQRTFQLRATCLLEHWRIARGQYGTVARGTARLRGVRAPRDPPGLDKWAETCAAWLDAQAATAQRRPDALRLVERVDSLMREGIDMGLYQGVNLTIGLMFETLGQPGRALAAVRRHGFSGFVANLAEYLRVEGRLAAATGDHAGAMRAYQQYLDMRLNPEPSVQPEVDAVRADLARLVSAEGN